MLGLTYISDAAPGRHTPGTTSLRLESEGLKQYPEIKLAEGENGYEHQSKIHALGISYNQVFSNCGLCLFANTTGCKIPLIEFINIITGWDFTVDEAITTGRRITTLRQAFNAREGIKTEDFSLPDRMAKTPPMGPLAGRGIDFIKLRAGYYKAMGWDPITGKPLVTTLRELGLKELISYS